MLLENDKNSWRELVYKYLNLIFQKFKEYGHHNIF